MDNGLSRLDCYSSMTVGVAVTTSVQKGNESSFGLHRIGNGWVQVHANNPNECVESESLPISD